MSEWKTESLVDLTDKIGSGATPRGGKEAYQDEGISLIRSQNVLDFSFTDEGLAFIDDSQAEKLKNVIVEKGDVLINITGDSVARVCQAPADYLPARVNQHVAILRPSHDLDTQFLKYYLLAPYQKKELLMLASSGATRNALTKGMLESYEIKHPPLPEQKAIAHILGKLDDKIELNRNMNETLEGMAQALFKSWFVDFDPVLDNALAAGNTIPEALHPKAEQRKAVPDHKKLLHTNPELTAQFPDRFTYNETLNKWIPEGWEVKQFGDVSRCFDSKRIPLSKKQREEKKPGHYPYYGATSINDYINEYIFDDTYLLLGEDGSVIREDGTPFTQYVWGKIWVNNHAHVLQGDASISTEHLMTFIRNQNMSPYITGAVQLKINQKNMNSIPFLLAQHRINIAFNQYLEGFYLRYKSNVEQTETLTKLRDTLLPQLISGKVRVPEEVVEGFGGEVEHS